MSKSALNISVSIMLMCMSTIQKQNLGKCRNVLNR